MDPFNSTSQGTSSSSAANTTGFTIDPSITVSDSETLVVIDGTIFMTTLKVKEACRVRVKAPDTSATSGLRAGPPTIPDSSIPPIPAQQRQITLEECLPQGGISWRKEISGGYFTANTATALAEGFKATLTQPDMSPEKLDRMIARAFSAARAERSILEMASQEPYTWWRRIVERECKDSWFRMRGMKVPAVHEFFNKAIFGRSYIRARADQPNFQAANAEPSNTALAIDNFALAVLNAHSNDPVLLRNYLGRYEFWDVTVRGDLEDQGQSTQQAYLSHYQHWLKPQVYNQPAQPTKTQPKPQPSSFRDTFPVMSVLGAPAPNSGVKKVGGVRKKGGRKPRWTRAEKRRVKAMTEGLAKMGLKEDKDEMTGDSMVVEPRGTKYHRRQQLTAPIAVGNVDVDVKDEEGREEGVAMDIDD